MPIVTISFLFPTCIVEEHFFPFWKFYSLIQTNVLHSEPIIHSSGLDAADISIDLSFMMNAIPFSYYLLFGF